MQNGFDSQKNPSLIPFVIEIALNNWNLKNLIVFTVLKGLQKGDAIFRAVCNIHGYSPCSYFGLVVVLSVWCFDQSRSRYIILLLLRGLNVLLFQRHSKILSPYHLFVIILQIRVLWKPRINFLRPKSCQFIDLSQPID